MTAGDTTNVPDSARQEPNGGAGTATTVPGEATATATAAGGRLESIRPYLPREFTARLVDQLTVGSYPQVVEVEIGRASCRERV